MKKVSFDEASGKHIHIMALGVTLLVFLMLVSIAGEAPFADIQNSGSNNVSNFNKFDKAINSYEKQLNLIHMIHLLGIIVHVLILPSTKWM
jgi:hypothetical protein